MNNKTILGISLGAVFAIGMILSPAFANGGALEGDILDGLLKDHSDGKQPANNPAHWTIGMTSYGNWTNYAVNTVDEFGFPSEGDVVAVGVGIVNGSGYATFVASHDINDCNNQDCGGFLEHGHGVQLDVMPSDDCDGYDAEVVDGSLIDIGKTSLTISGGMTEIKLKGIPADIEVVDYSLVCNTNDIVEDVAILTAFEIVVGKNDKACIDIDGIRSLDAIDAKDGPDNPNNGKTQKRDGGFNSSDESFCPT